VIAVCKLMRRHCSMNFQAASHAPQQTHPGILMHQKRHLAMVIAVPQTLQTRPAYFFLPFPFLFFGPSSTPLSPPSTTSSPAACNSLTFS
jgi:hypothetical protein